MLIIHVNSGGVLQFICLLLDLSGDSWMAMTHSRGRDSCKEIQVFSASVIIKVLHMSLNDEKWLLIKHKGSWAAMIFSHFHDSLV